MGTAASAALAIIAAVVAYSAAGSLGRRRLHWVLASAFFLLPVIVLVQLQPPHPATDANLRRRLVARGTACVAVFAFLAVSFPRPMPWAPFGTFEARAIESFLGSDSVQATGPLVQTPDGEFRVAGDLSPSVLLAAIGLALSLLILNHQPAATLACLAFGAVAGLVVDLADRLILIKAAVAGPLLENLPSGPFAVASVCLALFVLSVAWFVRPRAAA